MSYEQRDNSGVLFKNDRKESSRHPDYTGNAMIDGRDYWLSAWIKSSAKGKCMSIALKPKDGQTERKPAMAGGKRTDMDDSEIPF